MKKIRTRRIRSGIALLLILIVAAGCGKKAEEDTQAATEAETTPAPPATLAPAAGEPFCNMARTRRSSQAANRTPPITVWS